MVMKLLKKESENELLVERIMYTKHYRLVLQKNWCIGCEICGIVCPREAIETVKPVKVEGENLNPPSITVDENKCSFCGICTAICPFGAFTLTVNGENVIPVVEKESFPKVIHDITVDETKCPVDCIECQDACPFELIKVGADKTTGTVKVEVDEEHCPGCRLCEVKCPYNAVTVRKIVSGFIKINTDKCPEGCRDCVDVCPIPGVLKVSDDGKVEVDDFCCIYCGVCRIVCPVEEAIQLDRSSVLHTPVHSGAWNKALEKLTSTKGLTKELRSKLTAKVRETVRRRVG